MPESVRILLVVLSVPPSLALGLQFVYLRVVLFRLFEVLDEMVVDLRVVAGLLALRILSVLVCKLGFFWAPSLSADEIKIGFASL